MNDKDKIYLHHILDAISRIEEYVQKLNDKEFLGSPLVQDGVIRQIEILGEAVKRLSQEFRDQIPAIPWKDIAGMRDKLNSRLYGC